MHDTPHRLGQPLVAHRLEHVVDDVELEGVDGVPLVRGDEDDRRLRREAGEHPGEVEAAEARHLHVHEDRVELLLVDDPQGRLPGGRGDDLPHRGVSLEHPDELVERGSLVVDGQHAQGAGQRLPVGRHTGSGWAAHARTPGWNFGRRTVTLVPAPWAVSMTRP